MLDDQKARLCFAVSVVGIPARPLNFGGLLEDQGDASLDPVRYAPTTASDAAAMHRFQRAILERDAPWASHGENRVRAVSRRFEVQSEPGRDIMTELRLWIAAAEQRARTQKMIPVHELRIDHLATPILAPAEGSPAVVPLRLRVI